MLKTSRPVAKRHLAVAALATATLALTACAPTDEADTGTDAGSESSESSESPAETPAADECTPDTMETVADGTLTIATDDPAYEPWFVDNDPTNGEGYESAVAYAIAEQLGYTAEPGHLGHGAVQQGRPARPEGLRLRRQPGLDHRGPPQGRRLLLRLLRRRADRHHQQGQRDRRHHQRRRPRRRQARRAGRHDQLHRDHRPDPALAGPGRLRHQRPGGPGAQATARSTASSSTCPPPTS